MNTRIFNAFSELNRFNIIELLRDKPLPVGEIADTLHIRQPQVSKHLRVLADAGIVEVRQNAQQRIYSLQPQPFEELDQWLSSYRKIWNSRLDRLEEYIDTLHGKERNDRSK